MNDNDLERRLRSESGPREQGYNPNQLPASLETPPNGSRPSRTVRVAVLAGAVAAGVLAVAVGSALMSGVPSQNGVGAGKTATPMPSDSPRQPTECQPIDLALSAEPWGGAAGSRGTVVTVRLADGRYPCLFADEPGAQLATAGGVVISIDGLDAQEGVIDAGDERSVAVTWSNWCGQEISDPLTLALRSGGVAFPVAVPEGAGPVPPCNGENAPSVLNVNVLSGS